VTEWDSGALWRGRSRATIVTKEHLYYRIRAGTLHEGNEVNSMTCVTTLSSV